MGTVVAIEAAGGVAIASDTSATEEGVVTSENTRRLLEFESMVAGVTGSPGGIQTFRRRLESELRAQRIEHGDGIDLERLARIASRESERADVDAVVAARDSDGSARVREVGADGRVLSSPTVALGSGAAIALGQLEALDLDLDLDEAADAVRDVIHVVMERDAETDGEIDVRTIASDSSDADHG